jgi:hypothetical protein
MHAYRERRYADFARLAGSHWTRLAGTGTGSGAVEGRRPNRPGCSARATRLPYRPGAGFGKLGPNPSSAPGWSPRLAGQRQRSPPRRGCVFVACNTLCFSREPLESALGISPSSNSTRLTWRSSRRAPPEAVGGGREPRGGAAPAPARAEPDAGGAGLDFGDAGPAPARRPAAVRGDVPPGQAADRRRPDDPGRPAGHPLRRRGPPALDARRLRDARGARAGPRDPLGP